MAQAADKDCHSHHNEMIAGVDKENLRRARSIYLDFECYLLHLKRHPVAIFLAERYSEKSWQTPLEQKELRI
jgi:hypothetical protein